MSNQEMYADPAEIRHTIGAAGHFTLKNVSGDIDVRGVDGDEVIVRARSEHGRDRSLPLTVHKADASLSIAVDQSSFSTFGGWFGNHDGIDFEVSVPRSARIEIGAVSSDVTGRELSGEQAYKTVSGDIEIELDGGRVRITSVSGDIEVRARKPSEVSANSTSGDVHVSGDVVRAFDARTVSGDIDFRAGLAAGPLHSVETVSGDLSVDATTGVSVDVKKSLDFGRDGDRTVVAGDGAAQLRFRTLSGDLRLAGQVRQSRHERHGRHDERHQARQMKRHAARFFDLNTSRPDEETTEVDAFTNSQPPTVVEQRPMSQLEVLEALERGEIDIDEATRRLEEVSHA